jgi:branched-chain amino acid transport system permease protein
MTGSLWLKIAPIVILSFLFPLFLNDSALSLITEALILALAATALNILLGGCGIVSFGHAGFFAVGAYTFGLLLYYHLASFWVAMVLAILAVILYGIITGWFVVRLVEIYFALLCLGFSQVIWVITSVWYGVTGGDDGLNGIPIIKSLFSINSTYYFVLAAVGICLLALYLIRGSPFGRYLHALRDNRTRASFIGVNTRRSIYIAYVISGFFCGIAGILIVIQLHSAFPSYAGFVKSGDFLFVCLLGGMYSFLGPLVGAFLFIFLNFFICRYTEYWPLFMGLGIILIALFFRGGVVGFMMNWYRAHIAKEVVYRGGRLNDAAG